MTTGKRSDLSRDDVSVIVNKVLQRHSQIERNRILELLLEMDKDRTEAKIETERLKSELQKQLHELEVRKTEQLENKQQICQSALKEKFEDLEVAVEKAQPNYWAIIGLIVALFLPFMGWVYSVQISAWENRVKCAELQKEVAELQEKLRKTGQ